MGLTHVTYDDAPRRLLASFSLILELLAKPLVLTPIDSQT